MTTFALALREVLYEVLKADSALGTALGVSVSKPYAVFRGQASAGVDRPYIVIGSPTEDPLRTFGKSHTTGTEAIHIWSNKTSDEEVLGIYSHVNRLLDRTNLVVPGLAKARGATRIIFILPVTERGVTVNHGLIEYSTTRISA